MRREAELWGLRVADWIYPSFVFVHIMLFVAWLGGDIGVFILGQHFRKRDYPLETRFTLLKLLVLNDMAPRTAWALMVPVSVTLVVLGGWAALPGWLIAVSWIVGGVWLWLVWTAYLNDQTPLARRLRRVEFWLKVALTAAYAALAAAGIAGVLAMPGWLTAKAGLFALIFAFAIMIDVAFKAAAPHLQRLVAEGSKEEIEVPLRRAMDRTRVWVLALYALLVITAGLGTIKPVF